MAGTAEPLRKAGLCLLAAGSAWLVLSLAEPVPPALPAQTQPDPYAEPGDRPGLRRLMAACAAADEAAIPRLQKLGASPDPAVAGNAIRALGRLQAADGDPAIVAMLRDERPRVRHEAIVALGASGNPASIPLLEPLLQGRDHQGRLLAIQALAQLGATEVLQRLVADPATDAGTRSFVRAASQPVHVPRLLASTAGIESR